jgi:hypothetical protein
MNNVFITGLYRSGTTLVEKIIQNNPEIFIANQPTPFLFFELKNKILKEDNVEYYPPLNTLFSEKYEDVNLFKKKIDSTLIDHNDLVSIMNKSYEYKGGLTKEIKKITNKLDPGTLIKVYRQIITLLAKEFNYHGNYFGSKEVLCEEYIPYFIGKDVKTILVYRDPRDVITSLNYGKGEDYTGAIRPTLYNLRKWRKSIAFVLKYKSHPNFHSIKYEDLINSTCNTLEKTSNFLGIDINKKLFNNGIKDQYGNLWKSNSSHNVTSIINNDSIKKYLKVLPEEMIRYIETICFPELLALGYDLNYPRLDVSKIKSFKEPYDNIRNDFERDYSSTRKHVNEELYRLELLSSSNTLDIEKWFIFGEVYKELKKYYK